MNCTCCLSKRWGNKRNGIYSSACSILESTGPRHRSRSVAVVSKWRGRLDARGLRTSGTYRHHHPPSFFSSAHAELSSLVAFQPRQTRIELRVSSHFASCVIVASPLSELHSFTLHRHVQSGTQWRHISPHELLLLRSRGASRAGYWRIQAKKHFYTTFDTEIWSLSFSISCIQLTALRELLRITSPQSPACGSSASATRTKRNTETFYLTCYFDTRSFQV